METSKNGAIILLGTLLLLSLLSTQSVSADPIITYTGEYHVLGGTQLVLTLENMGYIASAQMLVSYVYYCEPTNEQFVTNMNITSDTPGLFYLYIDLAQPENPSLCNMTPQDIIVAINITSYEAYEEPAPNEHPTVEILSATPSGGDAPLEVLFQSDADDADGTIDKWEWDFDDGTTLDGNGYPQPVIHTYTDPGTYLARIKVWDDGDLSGSDLVKINVYVEKLPIEGTFSYSGVQASGEAITFDASGLLPVTEPVKNYSWNFGDENIASGILTVHSYEQGGTYTVTLTVTYTDDTTATVEQDVVIESDQVPVAIMEISGTQRTGHTLTFDANESYDPEGEAITASWNFGDGSDTVSGLVVEHSFDQTGTYVITLTASDNTHSGHMSSTLTITLNMPPAAYSSIHKKTDDCMTINASAIGSSDPDSDILSYYWDFGDGITANGEAVEHTFEDAGTYTVTLTVSDGALESVSQSDIEIVKKSTLGFIPYMIPLLAIIFAIAAVYHYRDGHKRPFDDLDLTSKE